MLRIMFANQHCQRGAPVVVVCVVQVDVIVSTIGFPLVGGPAGTMEGGRQAEVAQEILSSKNVPYMVSAPLLIQDLRSWTENGVAGLQSVVRSVAWLCNHECVIVSCNSTQPLRMH
jgi:hypothetical protein